MHHVRVATGTGQQNQAAKVLRPVQTLLGQSELTLLGRHLGEDLPLLFALRFFGDLVGGVELAQLDGKVEFVLGVQCDC